MDYGWGPTPSIGHVLNGIIKVLHKLVSFISGVAGKHRVGKAKTFCWTDWLLYYPLLLIVVKIMTCLCHPCPGFITVCQYIHILFSTPVFWEDQPLSWLIACENVLWFCWIAYQRQSRVRYLLKRGRTKNNTNAVCCFCVQEFCCYELCPLCFLKQVW